MKKKVIAYARVEEPVLNRLKEQFDVEFFADIDTRNDEGFLASLKEAEGIIGLELVVDKALLDNAPNLKIVSNVSVGYNNLDIKELTARGILATNTPDVLTDTVADMIFSLVLATGRRVTELDHYVKNRQWTETLGSEYYGANIHHKTLGIIGMGAIGQAVAKRGRCGFDMDILYYNRSRKPEAEEKYQASYVNLETLLKNSDYVVAIIPLTPETERLIGLDEFKLMKKSAFFINGARGRIIDEKALIEALNKEYIAGAGLDVFENEPVEADNPLLDMHNVVTLPHIGSSTYETELAMSELAAKNLIAGLTNEKPPTLINPEVWERRNE